MDENQVQRVGDPAATRLTPRGLDAWRGPGLALLGVVVFTTLAYTTTQSFLQGDPLGVSSPFFGVIACVVVLGVGLVLWAVLWRKSRVGLKRARSEHPSSFVTAARMPSLALPEGSEWLNAAPVGNRMVILIVDESALVVTNTDGSPLLKVAASEVRGVEAVEYVEYGKASDGIAIRTSSALDGVVLQIINIRGLWVQDVSYRHFGSLIDEIKSALVA